ncbi:iron complex outermembrane recepter protein [Mucilaginibacter pineti]|uniref:Iron complex outermembrane recepter protein n=1 Tax=Mucilaginibacter pineti TaxID=1391627 RepID=A0A1G7I3D8_9SPHI|nr:SusC/RagA family TonB-linked outer membrane protein [Mucilaginibacter pineti]SDF07113.1 iron complex outermembrane recepter protein [Mucilaginibacter pineti]
MRKNYSKKYVLLCAFLMMSVMAFAQTGSIKGKVLDETNQPLPGASVSIDGTTMGSTTDLNGNYTISGVKTGNVTVTAKFVGYTPIKKAVSVSSGVNELNFGLKPDNQNLNEVVVVGYGTQRKKDLTGSVVSVTAKDFNQGPITTPEQLITGKVAGVQITSNSGAPGSGSTIRIRGGASLSASNDPLIVIDGIPLSNTAISGVANPLSLINPNDIESFNILKDASATAIYGSRASNGVIIITTKKGKSGKLSVNFNSLSSLSEITKEVSVLNADQFRTAVQTYSPDHVALLGKANTDWQSLIYRKAYTYDNNISVTGGIKGIPYRLSVGFLNQDGIVKTDNLKRTTATFNINHDFLDGDLKVDLTLKGAHTESHFAADVIGSAVSFDPTQSVYSNDKTKFGGYFEWLDSGNPNTLAPRNPVGLLNEQNAVGKSTRGIGTLSLTYIFPFLKELQANATFGGDLSNGEGSNLIPATAASKFAQKGSYTSYYNQNYTYNTDYYLKYSKDFKDIKSHFDIQAGYSYQYYNTYVKNFQEKTGDKVTPVNSLVDPTFGQYYIESPFARANFSFDDKYLLTASIRDDRSSRFSEKYRNGYFPSVAFAWRAKEESFLKSVDVLSDLKIRASYGITGQQDLPTSYFPYLAVYDPSNVSAQYQFGSSFVNTLRADSYNVNLKWESTATTNLGLDYGFFNGRLTGSIDVYNKKTKDLLLNAPIAAGTNLSNYLYVNVGNLTTKGLEFNANIAAIASKDLNWNIGYNVSLNKRTITNISLTGDPNQKIATGAIPGGVGNTIQQWQAGQNPGAFFVYQQVYNNGIPLEGVYVDRNNNGTTTDDKYLYKQTDPKVFMGLNSNVNYKRWNLGFSARASLGNYTYNAQAAANAAYVGLKFSKYLVNLPSSVLKTNFTQYQLYSDYYVENSSFLRMDNATLGYTFGKTGGPYTLRASFNVQNVFVITNYTGLDPEGSGIDNNFYPRPRIYSLGLNLGF